jgi:hypothetical protein
MDTPRFTVGQTVRLLQSVINRGKSITCQVLQIMPFEGGSFQYRVRGQDERFDRIAREHELAELPPQHAETAQREQPGRGEGLSSPAPQAMKGKG